MFSTEDIEIIAEKIREKYPEKLPHEIYQEMGGYFYGHGNDTFFTVYAHRNFYIKPINRLQSEFMYARAIAHYLMHTFKGEIEGEFDLVGTGTMQEKEASWFAACLAMPRALMKEAVKIAGGVEKAAALSQLIFGVDEELFLKRAKDLGLQSSRFHPKDVSALSV
jgi:Zn-dependent peptidase ImmA (M78 family)